MKCIVRQFTGKSRLLRIFALTAIQEARKDILLKECIDSSRISDVRMALSPDSESDVENQCRRIMAVKNVNEEKFMHFYDEFCDVLYRLHTLRRLKISVESLRSISYSVDNLQHEASLLRLWNLLSPNEALEKRNSNQWVALGFQGDNPQTDFRGMGILSLDNLLFFAENHTSLARAILLRSQHPTSGHTFAIVGINLTNMLIQLLQSDKIDVAMLSLISNRITEHRQEVGETTSRYVYLNEEILVKEFHKLYCFAFYEFDKFWFQSPRDIMQFNVLMPKFKSQFKKQLCTARNVATLLNHVTV